LRKVRLDVPLPSGFREFVADGCIGRNEKLIGGFEGRPWRETGRFSELAWTDLGFAAAWDAAEVDPNADRSALAFFMGAGETRAIDGSPSAAALLEGQRYRLSSGVPGMEQAALPGAVLTNWSQRPTIGGSYSSFAPRSYTRFYRYLWTEAEKGAAGPIFGNVAFAGEQFSDDFYGFMNGAVESGQLAAKALLAG
jgi:monoamine oxidase